MQVLTRFETGFGVPRQCSTLYWSECTCVYVGPQLDGRLNNGQFVSTVRCCTIRMNRAPCHLALTLPEIFFLSSTLRHSLHFCLVDRTKCMGRLTIHRIESCRQVSSSRHTALPKGRGTCGAAAPPPKRKYKNTDFVVKMVSNVLRDIGFSLNEPPKSIDDYYTGILNYYYYYYLGKCNCIFLFRLLSVFHVTLLDVS